MEEEKKDEKKEEENTSVFSLFFNWIKGKNKEAKEVI
jgi:hypothetical protein